MHGLATFVPHNCTRVCEVALLQEKQTLSLAVCFVSAKLVVENSSSQELGMFRGDGSVDQPWKCWLRNDCLFTKILKVFTKIKITYILVDRRARFRCSMHPHPKDSVAFFHAVSLKTSMPGYERSNSGCTDGLGPKFLDPEWTRMK